jgi:hypothetical protein
VPHVQASLDALGTVVCRLCALEEAASVLRLAGGRVGCVSAGSQHLLALCLLIHQADARILESLEGRRELVQSLLFPAKCFLQRLAREDDRCKVALDGFVCRLRRSSFGLQSREPALSAAESVAQRIDLFVDGGALSTEGGARLLCLFIPRTGLGQQALELGTSGAGLCQCALRGAEVLLRRALCESGRIQLALGGENGGLGDVQAAAPFALGGDGPFGRLLERTQLVDQLPADLLLLRTSRGDMFKARPSLRPSHCIPGSKSGRQTRARRLSLGHGTRLASEYPQARLELG